MTGRNSRPQKNGPSGHPSRLDQYRESFPIHEETLNKTVEELNEEAVKNSRFTM